MENRRYSFAFDGNEANVKNRVGSNVYAFEILKYLHETTLVRSDIHWTILLAQSPEEDFPPENNLWHYEIVKPTKFWTQWALPIHLFKNKNVYDLLYTPGHYAPRFSAVPYVSSVMDLAFLKFPDQFTNRDAFQLKHWTEYSVLKAKKIITISEFSKKEIAQTYGLPLEKIEVAYPSYAMIEKYSNLRWKSFVKKHKLQPNQYFLYLGTIQPRKNLEALIEAFEIFYRNLAADQVHGAQAKKIREIWPQLVIAGKTGWLADKVLNRVKNSPIKDQIVLTGFVDNSLKKPLYEYAQASLLIGFYEGFGIPPLESLSVGTPAIVSDSSSLPEAVGRAGLLVNPNDPQAIAGAMKKVWTAPKIRRQTWSRTAKKHSKEFTWKKTGEKILTTLLAVVNKRENNGS
ncbi:MAG: hypothetical protein AUK08_00605 [Candidatus Pacebacteria bacterium CG2_30_36_39]|nr:glycosyltransferase family 4 protein [Candidatus Pacearchaeota archaeon]OIP74596.1 MAG: hypothetical protein AUK08_00605 [Candidatus Pacebacteria bacterium CG2_30_36_39]